MHSNNDFLRRSQQWLLDCNYLFRHRFRSEFMILQLLSQHCYGRGSQSNRVPERVKNLLAWSILYCRGGQPWHIACLEVAHSRFKIFRAIWVSVLSSGRKICHSNNISKKKKSPHLVGLAFESDGKGAAKQGMTFFFFFWRSPLNMALFRLQSIKFILWSQNKAIFSGDLQKKKKKKTKKKVIYLH